MSYTQMCEHKKNAANYDTVDWPKCQMIETEGFNQAKIRRILAKLT